MNLKHNFFLEKIKPSPLSNKSSEIFSNLNEDYPGTSNATHKTNLEKIKKR